MFLGKLICILNLQISRANIRVLKVLNDLLCYLEWTRSVMYIGLDLSAACDIIDYQFLFELLLKRNGLQYVVFIFIKIMFRIDHTSYYKWMFFW